MKLIIDISDEKYNKIKEWEDNITDYQTTLTLYRAVRDGIPYEERKPGKWIKKIDDVGFVSYICSECGFELELEDCSDSYYCSDCGAKMVEAGNEKTGM